jgi:hypothetical protein
MRPEIYLGRTRTSSVGKLTFALLTLGLALSAGNALAQTEAENTAAARALALEGVSLAEAGDCKGAIDRFSRAEQLFHAPTILLGLGECQCKVGLLVEGTENLNRVAREDLGPKPPPPFVQAQARAKTLLAEYLPKVGKLTLTVETPSTEPYTVTIDGAALPSALVGVARPINPGEHQLSVSGDAYLAANQAFTVTEGEAATLAVKLELKPLEAVAEEEPKPIPPPPKEPAAEPNRVPAYIAFGVGAVGLGVGTVFGLSAMGTKGDLEDVCRQGSCPPSEGGDIDSMQSDATIATIGFGVGLLGVGAGVYLWVTAEPEQPSTQAAENGKGISVQAFLAPGQVGFRGGF